MRVVLLRMRAFYIVSGASLLVLVGACFPERAGIHVKSPGLDSGTAEDAAPGDGSDGGTADRGLLDTRVSDGASRDVSSDPDSATRPDASSPPDTGPGIDTYVQSGTPLDERLDVAELDVGEAVRSGVSNWRIWGRGNLAIAPVFTVPLDDGQTLVGYTVSGSNARVARLGATDQLVTVHNLADARELRGLAAEPDGRFAALLWDDASDAIFVHRYEADGSELWVEELSNSTNVPDDFGIGDSRMAYGNGRYGAYYHVHSDTGHEGDTLKWVNAETGAESTGWSWGCSHSMSALLRFHQGSSSFEPVCVTDCYPGTSGSFAENARGGIYLNHSIGPVLEVDAACNGSVAGELGGLAPAGSAGWRLVFNAHQNPMEPGQGTYDRTTMNQDIGLAVLTSNTSYEAVQWLTSTPDIDEADASIAPWQPAGDSTEQYVVGWAEPGSPYVYKLARIDATGIFLEAPTDISALAQWGRRDDPMRRHSNGDVVWAWFTSAGSSTLKFARLRAGGS